MPRASLTRRVTFGAAHRFWRADWDDTRNAEVFGAHAHPHFHGHTYICDVTVEGPIDPTTGMIVDLARFDAVLQAEVRQRFADRRINLEVPEFADGTLVPTGEVLARFIFERVQAALGAAARVAEVRVAEDETLSATYRGDAG